MTHGHRVLSTGLTDLDRATGGGQAGHLWVLGGPAGVGKTVFSLGLARAAAIRTRVPAAVISTREDPNGLRDQVLAAEAGFLLGRERDGVLSEEQRLRLAQITAQIDEAHLTITGVAPESLLTAAQCLARTGVQVLVLDEFPEAQPGVLGELKALALETATWALAVVVDLDQRPVSRRAILSGADVLLWVERDDQHDPASPRVGEADIWVRRSDRARGTWLTVAYQERYQRFVDLTPASI